MALHPNARDHDQIATANPLELSSRIIDTAEASEPTNRVTNTLVELDDNVAMVESFSHMIVFRTEGGLVTFDASH